MPIATTREPKTVEPKTIKRRARVGCWILFDDDRTETLTPLHLRRRQAQENLSEERAPAPITDGVAGVINVADVEDVAEVAVASTSSRGRPPCVVLGGGSNKTSLSSRPWSSQATG